MAGKQHSPPGAVYSAPRRGGAHHGELLVQQRGGAAGHALQRVGLGLGLAVGLAVRGR